MQCDAATFLFRFIRRPLRTEIPRIAPDNECFGPGAYIRWLLFTCCARLVLKLDGYNECFGHVAYIRWLLSTCCARMVLILDGNSEHVAHAWCLY